MAKEKINRLVNRLGATLYDESQGSHFLVYIYSPKHKLWKATDASVLTHASEGGIRKSEFWQEVYEDMAEGLVDAPDDCDDAWWITEGETCPICEEGKLTEVCETLPVKFRGQERLAVSHYSTCDACLSEMVDRAQSIKNVESIRSARKDIDNYLRYEA